MRKALVMGLILLLIILNGVSCNAEPPSSLELSLPDYKVTTVGNVDYVEIPGGETLIEEEGRPLVPYYVATIYYPKGYRVQDVIMKERSGLRTVTALRLPAVVLHPVLTVEMKKGWYPEEEYRWRTWENSDGSSALTIAIFPFYYNPETAEAKYYTHYEFNIDCILSTVSIIDLVTDKAAYDPGEVVTVTAFLNSSGESKDIVASTLIRQYDSDSIIEGLTLRTLHNVVGESSFSELWYSDGFTTGNYYVEVTLNDTSGNLLERRTCGFKLGRALVNVTNFNVEPKHFAIGDQVRISLDVMNSGSTKPSGSCVFRILDADGTVEEFVHNFTSLALGSSLRFTSVWNTSSARRGDIYHVLAYISYESQSTPPAVAVISTNFFPIARFSYSPAKVGLGEAVLFEASGSSDRDGNLANMAWDFGDGGRASGMTVTHAYHELGDYKVMLTVTDDEGASNETELFIKVVMMYSLNVSSNVGVAIGGSGMYKEGDEVVLSALSSAGIPGIFGLLGAKYVFKEWSGSMNTTSNPVTLVITGYTSNLEMRAIYAEDYTGAMIATSVVIIAVVAIIAFSIRKRGKRLPPKPP